MRGWYVYSLSFLLLGVAVLFAAEPQPSTAELEALEARLEAESEPLAKIKLHTDLALLLEKNGDLARAMNQLERARALYGELKDGEVLIADTEKLYFSYYERWMGGEKKKVEEAPQRRFFFGAPKGSPK